MLVIDFRLCPQQGLSLLHGLIHVQLGLILFVRTLFLDLILFLFASGESLLLNDNLGLSPFLPKFLELSERISAALDTPLAKFLRPLPLLEQAFIFCEEGGICLLDCALTKQLLHSHATTIFVLYHVAEVLLGLRP